MHIRPSDERHGRVPGRLDEPGQGAELHRPRIPGVPVDVAARGRRRRPGRDVDDKVDYGVEEEGTYWFGERGVVGVSSYFLGEKIEKEIEKNISKNE